MRPALLALLLLACSYADPEYDGLTFKCDDSHGCPPEHTCYLGACVPLGPSADGVECAASLRCAAGTICCISSTGSGASCVSPLDGRCAGANAAFCDGVEDCADGSRCCGGATAACGDRSCARAVCRDNTDCSTTTMCCHDDAAVPWGHCELQCSGGGAAIR